MRFGIIRNISGNAEALADADRRFDELGVETKVCLGEVVGIYPYPGECIAFLAQRNYTALRTHIDDAFVSFCSGGSPFDGWSARYLVEALEFAGTRVSDAAVNYLRSLPVRFAFGEVAFEGLAPIHGGYVYDQEQAAAAFRTWRHRTVFNAAHNDPYIWHEDLSGSYLPSGRTVLEPKGRLLISTGGLGSFYHGSAATKRSSAVVFDDQDRSVVLFHPKCAVRDMLDQLRRTEYPKRVLDYLDKSEYRDWF
jgi:hypothetical protein